MAPRHPRRRRLLLPLLLAATLAAEVTGLAIARTLEPAALTAATAAGASTVAAQVRAQVRDQVADPASRAAVVTEGARDTAHAITAARASRPSATLAQPPLTSIEAPARAASSATSVPPGASPYAGRNHVWIPVLGINRSVSLFPCSRTRPPDNYVYRWGCAGRNNVYLLGHAYSVFKPLHDAFVGGRLRKGMTVFYANGAGIVHTYAVIWWRVVAPTTAASWAWAAQSQPSMTLQTCVGANSQYRLMVRLVQVG